MKYILFTLIAFTAITSFGQFNKGQWMVNASFSFNTSKDETNFDQFTVNNQTTKNASMSLNISVPFFIKDNLAFGIGPNYNSSMSSSSSSSNESIQKEQGIQLIAFIRKYIPLQERFGLYGQIQAGAGGTESSSIQKFNGVQNPEFKNSGQQADIGIAFGAYVLATKRLVFQTGFSNIGWYSSKSKSASDIPNFVSSTRKRSGFSASLNTTFFYFGINYLFNGE